MSEILTWLAEFWPKVASGVWALVGYAVHRAADVRDDRRPQFWSRAMAWEIPSTVLIGFAVVALANAYDLPADAIGPLSALAGYLGPRGIEGIINRFVSKK